MGIRLLWLACFFAWWNPKLAWAEQWFPLPPVPDSLGVAGPFAGVTAGGLLVAGGANFPEKPPWQGGKKVWHETVWWLEKTEGRWKNIGSLPFNRGYGVSVTHSGWVVCVGGSDPQGHHADCFRLAVRDGKLITEKLPPLPTPLANACGAVLGDVLYLVGGQVTPDGPALDKVLALDLARPDTNWREEKPLLGKGRILASAGATDSLLVVAGGAALVDTGMGATRREYLVDTWGFKPNAGWSRLADLPKPRVAAPSPMPFRLGGLWLLGGDDGKQIGRDPAAHTGFDRGVLRYNPDRDGWEKAGEIPFAQVTVPVVVWNDLWVVPSGEVRPGVRSPNVWARKNK